MTFAEFLQIATAIGGVVTFGWGVVTYRDTKSRSSREPFLKQQFELCFQASNCAAQLATERDPNKWDAARSEFWRLYYGPLCVVENKPVAKAMIAVGHLLPKPDLPRPDKVPIADEAYRDASIQLAQAVRTLIQNAWGVHLGPLE